MTAVPPPSHERESFADLAWPVGAMFGTQSVAVIVFLSVPIMATEIAPEFGVAAKDIGIFMSIVFASAMIFSAASGSLIRRYGGIRANQIGMTFSACSLVLVLSGSLPLLFLAAVLVGVGYGPNTPSGAHVLARVTPPRARAFIFSLKQSGAPLGGLVAGILIPSMVVAYGWRGAIVGTVAIALLSVCAVQPLRARLDDDRDANASVAFAAPWGAIARVIGDVALRRLTLVAFCLTSIQAIVLTFLMIILVQEVGLEFTLAGSIFAASQAAGACGRIIMGWIADFAVGARATLAVLGLGSALVLAALVTLGPTSSLSTVVVLSVLAGVLSFSWNGVFLAEIAKSSSPAEVGTVTGGSLFFLYGGIVFGPIATSALISLTGGIATPLLLVAALTIVASANLFRAS